jgi:hypothetical protein
MEYLAIREPQSPAVPTDGMYRIIRYIQHKTDNLSFRYRHHIY